MILINQNSEANTARYGVLIPHHTHFARVSAAHESANFERKKTQQLSSQSGLVFAVAMVRVVL